MDIDPLPNLLSAVPLLAQPVSPIFEVHAPTLGSWIALIIATLGLLASAYMSGSEIAFFSLSKVEIDEIDNERERERMKKLLSKPESLLATILVGNNLVNVMIIILSSFAMSQMFVINSTVLTFIMYSVILTFILLLFGEILPKIYATNNNMKFALFSAPGMATLMSTFSPLTRLMVQGST
ncbi:MAG: DUF21 domain-containing protein, partial [Muribaculaceae bacterium]|nr:DUF21 domain-containing protein [Muribaculaceae bacterium]